MCLAQYGGQNFILTAGFSVVCHPQTYSAQTALESIIIFFLFLVSIEARLLLSNTIFTAVDAILKAELFCFSLSLIFILIPIQTYHT